MVQVAASEHASKRWTSADADPAGTGDITSQPTASHDTLHASGGVAASPRLLPCPAVPNISSNDGNFSGGKSWALTGGVGALGLLTAAWLLQSGEQGIVLLGRSGRAVIPASLHSADGLVTIQRSLEIFQEIMLQIEHERR